MVPQRSEELLVELELGMVICRFDCTRAGVVWDRSAQSQTTQAYSVKAGTGGSSE